MNCNGHWELKAGEMNPVLQCELVSWRKVYQLARNLAMHIVEQEIYPDIIIAISRGGLVPARILCDFLNIYRLATIRIEHYKAGAGKQPYVRLSSKLCEDVRSKNVLIVDDVSDSGETLQLALDHVLEFSPAQVKTAVLHHKQVCAFSPDFYAFKVVKWRWLIYPWAVIEDVTGFIKNMKDMPVSPQQAMRRLETDYGIKITLATLEDIYTLLDRKGMKLIFVNDKNNSNATV